jgi:putative membrane protein
VFSTLALALAGPAGYMGGPVGFGFGFALFFLIPILLVVLLIVFLTVGRRRWMRAGGYGPGGHGNWSHGGWGAPSRNAESTLAERFAQGDIDEKEYRARLEVLRANNPAPTLSR